MLPTSRPSLYALLRCALVFSSSFSQKASISASTSLYAAGKLSDCASVPRDFFERCEGGIYRKNLLGEVVTVAKFNDVPEAYYSAWRSC